MPSRNFKPEPNDRITLKGDVYVVQQHPQIRTDPFAVTASRATVYKLKKAGRDGSEYALKVFKKVYREPSLLDAANRLKKYESVKGLAAARRIVIEPSDDAAQEYQDLVYAMLMPWIQGSTWFDLLLKAGEEGAKGRAVFDRRTALRLCDRFLDVMQGLAAVGVAHSDIAPGNVVVNVEHGDVQLLDLEDLWTPDGAAPKDRITGQAGYIHPSAGHDGSSPSREFTTWCREGDRYATAVLASEILVLSQPRLAALASDTGFFGGDRTSSLGAQRYAEACPFLRTVSPGFADLFERVWTSATLAACPTAAQLRECIAGQSGSSSVGPSSATRRSWWSRLWPRWMPSSSTRDVELDSAPGTGAYGSHDGVTWDKPGGGAVPPRDGVNWETPQASDAPLDSGVRWVTPSRTEDGSHRPAWFIGSAVLVAAMLALVAYVSVARSCSPAPSTLRTPPPGAVLLERRNISTVPVEGHLVATRDPVGTVARPDQAEVTVSRRGTGEGASRTDRALARESDASGSALVPSNVSAQIPPIPKVVAPNEVASKEVASKEVAANSPPTEPPPPAVTLQPPPTAPPPTVQVTPLPPPLPPPASLVPARYGGPSLGTLTYSGPPIVQNGEVVFRNLPPVPLVLTYDQDVWEARLSQAEGNTQRLILRNKKPGTQKKCVVNWRVSQ